MRLRNKVILLIAGFMLVMMSTVTPTFAQASVSHSIDPTYGPVGTQLSFNGNGCPALGGARADGYFEMFLATGKGQNQGSLIGRTGFRSNQDGSFSGTFDVSKGDVGLHQTQIACSSGTVQGATFEIISIVTTTVAEPTTSVVPVATTTAPTPSTTVPDGSSSTPPAAAGTMTTSSPTTAPPTAATTPSSTPSTTPPATNRLHSVQGTTTTSTLAITGSDTVDNVLIALSIICFGVAFLLSPYCSWFPQVEKCIRLIGRVIVAIVTPT
jgi:hypothetical protein